MKEIEKEAKYIVALVRAFPTDEGAVKKIIRYLESRQEELKD